MEPSAFFESTVSLFEILGVAAMLAGFAIAVAVTLVDLVRHRDPRRLLGAFRRTFGGGILLGLEVLVAADLVKTVTSGLALDDVLALSLIVVIRTVLSFTLQVEIDGDLPWRRAVTRSGAALIAESVRDTASAPQHHPGG